MNKSALVHQLVAIRGQLEALHATVTAALVSLAESPAGEEGCPHPADRRINTTVQGGHRKFLCLDCNTEHVDPE